MIKKCKTEFRAYLKVKCKTEFHAYFKVKCINTNPFTPKISSVILLSVCHKNSHGANSENLVLDHLIIS